MPIYKDDFLLAHGFNRGFFSWSSKQDKRSKNPKQKIIPTWKPPSPALPPKGEGSESILKFKKLKRSKNPKRKIIPTFWTFYYQSHEVIFKNKECHKLEHASNFPLGGLRGLLFCQKTAFIPDKGTFTPFFWKLFFLKLHLLSF